MGKNNDAKGKEGREPQRLGTSRLFGSLRDALTAAGRDTGERTVTVTVARSDGSSALPVPAFTPGSAGPQPDAGSHSHSQLGKTEVASQKDAPMKQPMDPKAADAARSTAQGQQTMLKPAGQRVSEAEIVPPTRPAAREAAAKPPAGGGEGRTQLLRGRQKVTRSKFHQDPVVGWLVLVGGAGLGAFRPIFEGNNTIGRATNQRIPIDFGDDTISAEEQAYIRYDSTDRKFLFVPNLAKTNVVQINDRKPTGAVELASMDVIKMGRTQLVFVPFCGDEFDWAELSEIKE